MSLPSYAYAGAADPEALLIDVSSSDTVPDLTVVTEASVSVRKPDGTTDTWDATISNQTTSSLRVTHVYADDGTDIADVGSYGLVVVLTTPSGPRRCEPIALPVRPAV
jgi:hypothetical protein